MDSDIGYLTAKKLLDDKYGDPCVVSNAYLKKVLEWPNIKTGDDAAVDRLATFLEQCLSAMTSLSYLNILDHPHNLQRLIIKLPFYLQDRWRREVIRIRGNGTRIPSLKDFAKFVQMEAKIGNDPVFSRSVLGRIQVPDKTPKRFSHGRDDPLYKQNNRATKVDESQDVQLLHSQCPYCKEMHDLDDCQPFVKRTLENRKAWLKERNMCFACFNAGHRANGCLQRKKCRTCPGKHPTSLHDPDFVSKIKKKAFEDDRKQNSDDGKFSNAHTTYKECSSTQDTDCKVTTMPIVPVKLIANEREITTYAMLDSCSTGTFILEDVRRELQIEGTDTNVLVNTMNGSQIHQTKVVTGLIVTDIDGNNQVTFPRTFSRDTIPATKDEIPTEELVGKWKHLSKIKIPSYFPEAKIGVVIGSNCPKAIEPKDFIVSEDGGPFAVKTWTVVGSQPRSNVQTNVSCNRTLIEEIVPGKPFQHHFVLESKVKEIITPQELNQMFEVEFSERPCVQEYGQSIQDKAFLKKMVEECKFKNGHYELLLPFVDGDQAYMPNNRDMAGKRMESLKKRFLKNPSFHADYVKFMSDLLSKDYARIAPAQSRQRDGKVWYLPHHGVYHPRKPNKVRVVFDCSAKYHGISLNAVLMQGPDLTNSLVGVLLRFRQSPVAFTADIESMYYQVRVPEDQRDFLRFLWWPDGDLSNEMKEYQMNVHIFGAVSSPSCANFGLNQAANNSEQDIGAETCNVLRKNFYVDDCLRSEETEDEAITRIDGVRRACSLGGFCLTKFICNRSRVLNTIPESERAKQVKRLELSNDNIHLERVLGVDWLVESDVFGFRIVLKDKPLTRRGILATVSSIYDLLGMAAPFLLIGKRILQDLCKDKVDWDDAVSDAYRAKWERWRKELLLLEEIKMRRCVKPDNFGSVKSRQLHHFSDASQDGYGQVSYLRLENDQSEIHVSFLMGKARVAPVKSVKLIQRDAFYEDIACISNRSRLKPENRDSDTSRRTGVKRSSQLSRLDPFLDQNGLLRVGGRLQKLEELDEGIRHPIIFARRGHFTDLIIRHAHQNTAHGGRGLTMNEIRNRYWIINGNSAVRYYISRCIECRRLRAKVDEQKMADLPKERITPAPPFTYCGIDYFGPFVVKEGRKEVKRYGVVFTCMASIHIETAVSLETDSFLNALRRFIARRGPVREIRSDQGTNLVGAEKQLKLALKEIDHDEIQKSLVKNNTSWLITWKRNPPSASHMGGVWERF